MGVEPKRHGRSRRKKPRIEQPVQEPIPVEAIELPSVPPPPTHVQHGFSIDSLIDPVYAPYADGMVPPTGQRVGTNPALPALPQIVSVARYIALNSVCVYILNTRTIKRTHPSCQSV